MNSDINSIIQNSKTIAIVGLSNNPERPSYEVAEYLMTHGFTIIPVNPHIDSVFSLKSYASLSEIPKETHIDVVDIFRKPEFVPAIVDEAIKVGADTIWMQEGVSHSEAAAKARSHGLEVVENMCMMKTHKDSL